jgi:DNA-binding CsgD family transcriptional regulator
MQFEFPWALVESALLGDESSGGVVPCTLRDGLLVDLVAEHPVISGAEYRRAVDRRVARVLRTFRVANFAAAVIELGGRHVGTLGSIVATGRAFSTLAHVRIGFDGPVVSTMVVESGLVGCLTGAGARTVSGRASQRMKVVCEPAAERTDLLTGDVSATYWARSWRLPPRLARLAVLLMAGVTPKVIAERLGLRLPSVRTYTERLLSRAGVHSHNELLSRALRDGQNPA